MKLQVTYQDGAPAHIERPPTLTEGYVSFIMRGSSAVWMGQDVDDLHRVMQAVENLPFVQAATMEVDA